MVKRNGIFSVDADGDLPGMVTPSSPEEDDNPSNSSASSVNAKIDQKPLAFEVEVDTLAQI